eukprot:6075076-Pyramimonas_sp.AAC.2
MKSSRPTMPMMEVKRNIKKRTFISRGIDNTSELVSRSSCFSRWMATSGRSTRNVRITCQARRRFLLAYTELVGTQSNLP